MTEQPQVRYTYFWTVLVELKWMLSCLELYPNTMVHIHHIQQFTQTQKKLVLQQFKAHLDVSHKDNR